MTKKIKLLIALTIICISAFNIGVFSAVADDTQTIDRTKVYGATNNVKIEYTDEGIHLKGGTGEDATVREVSAGEYDFAVPFSFTFRHDGLPMISQNSIKENLIYFHDPLDDTKGLYINPFITTSSVGELELRFHVVVNSASGSDEVLYDHIIVKEFDTKNYKTTFFTIGYDYEGKLVTFAFDGAETYKVDLKYRKNSTFTVDDDNNVKGDTPTEESVLARLPDNTVEISHKFTRGGIIVKNINGIPLHPKEKPQIREVGLPAETFDDSLSFSPILDNKGYNDVYLSVEYGLKGGDNFTELEPADAEYNVKFTDYGIYEFKFTITYDGGETEEITREVKYLKTTIDSVEGLFEKGNYVSLTDEGFVFDNKNEGRDGWDPTKTMAYGNFKLNGITELEYKLGNSPLEQTDRHKGIRFYFSDEEHTIMVNIFAKYTADKGFQAVTTIQYFDSEDRSSDLYKNHWLDMFFSDENNVFDPNALITVKYNPYAKQVTISKNGEVAGVFNLNAQGLPYKNYTLKTAFNHGKTILTKLNGFDLTGRVSNEQFDYPAPIIMADGIKTFALANEEIIFSKEGLVFDLFDMKPQLEIIFEKDGQPAEIILDGNNVILKFSENGTYTLTITAENAKGKTSEKVVEIAVVADELPPVISFEEDAFKDFIEGKSAGTYIVTQGDIISLPEAIVTDDSGREPELEILVLDPDKKVITLAGGQFIVHVIGTYYVEYKATDITGKTSTYSFSLISRKDEGENLSPNPDDKITEEEDSKKKGCKSANTLLLSMLPILIIGAAAGFKRRKIR